MRLSGCVPSIGSPVIKGDDTVGDFQQFVTDVGTRYRDRKADIKELKNYSEVLLL